MTIESKGRKRARDPNQLAKFIVDVASGQVEDRDSTVPVSSNGFRGNGVT